MGAINLNGEMSMSAGVRIAALLIASTALVSHAGAQDYGPYGYGNFGFGFDWDGFYSGVYGGGVPFGDGSLNAGIFAGVNMSYESAVFGVEAQLGANVDDELGLDALILGRGGMSFGDALVYGTAGTGLVDSEFSYAVGGGAEYGFTDYMSARGEVLGTGAWGSAPEDVRLALGVAFHL